MHTHATILYSIMDICILIHMCVYVYTIIFQIYLTDVVIELVEFADKFEFSQRSFIPSFSKTVNSRKRFPSQSQKGQ